MIQLVPYRSSWPSEFQQIATKLRAALGDTARAIHHIGSTSVSGLAAKDIIDIQVTVLALSAPVQTPLEQLGFRLTDIQTDHPPQGLNVPDAELQKRLYKTEHPPANVHLRIEGHFNQRYALLCRDFLRADPMAAHAYSEIKYQLVRYFPTDEDAYYDIKDPVFDLIVSGATHWAKLTSWRPSSSDC